MLNERIFTLITRLIYGRWARHYDEHHSPYEDACMASFSPPPCLFCPWVFRPDSLPVANSLLVADGLAARHRQNKLS